MANNDDLYNELFRNMNEDLSYEDKGDVNIAEMVLSSSLGIISRTRQIEDISSKRLLLRLITATALRISFIASVWLWIFRNDLWYGMPIFGILSILFWSINQNVVRVKNG